MSMQAHLPHRRRRATLAALAALVALATSGCGISSDDSPRDIPVIDQLPLDLGIGRDAGAAIGTARVYLLAPEVVGQAQSLQAVARDVSETPTELLAALFAGPNADELDRQFRTALPAGLQLLSVGPVGGVLRVNVSQELLQLSGQVLVDAVAQIVFTASEVDGVRSVKILIDGADRQWPAGNGELQTSPLTIYDYPGLVQSAQPAYPAVPSPPES
ncbi:MAG: GerMN domain-containing protein [Actinomycetota bacterium]|nr:GerMN domain-containing protein [Actinomycetota bacterium]